jgi:hypothetical protein
LAEAQGSLRSARAAVALPRLVAEASPEVPKRQEVEERLASPVRPATPAEQRATRPAVAVCRPPVLTWAARLPEAVQALEAVLVAMRERTQPCARR